MAIVSYVVFLGLFSPILGENCIIDNRPPAVRWEKQLRKDFFSCAFDIYTPPKPTSGLLTVTIRLILDHFKFDDIKQVFTAQIWMYTEWKDQRLKWNPKEYGGVNETMFKSWSIWTPSFKLHNSANAEDYDRYSRDNCEILSSGEASCAKIVIHETQCIVNLSNFPYDSQECNLEYGVWTIRGVGFSMNFSYPAISYKGVENGSQWSISHYKQKLQHEQSLQWLNMTLVLRREAQSLAAVILYPSYVVTAISLICSFLDVRNNIRLGLICFSILSHYYWLSVFGEYMPTAGKNPPSLLLYYRGSTVVTVFLFLVTMVLTVICKKKTASNRLVNYFNDFVYGTNIRYLVFPKWDEDCMIVVGEINNNEIWIKFANGVNILCTFVVIFAYIGLYFTFMPQPMD